MESLPQLGEATCSASAATSARAHRRWNAVVCLAAIGGFILAIVYGGRWVWQRMPTGSPPVFSMGPPFDLTTVTIDPNEILPGGPPKDGIPALTEPNFCSADKAAFLADNDRIIGVVLNNEPRAYPLFILNYHEIVNDRVDNVPLAVTYCPLCDSAVVFDRRTPLGERQFGVSGLLYNSNLLMYDRGGQAESLWSQMMTQGVSGPGARVQLQTLPVELTTWKSWRARYPNTRVLTPETGYNRPYHHQPYTEYFRTDRLMFPVRGASPKLPPKTPVLGVWSQTAARAYLASALSTEQPEITDVLDNKQIIIALDTSGGNLRVVRADKDLSWMYAFWFAWSAFRPNTTVYGESQDGQVQAVPKTKAPPQQ